MAESTYFDRLMTDSKVTVRPNVAKKVKEIAGDPDAFRRDRQVLATHTKGDFTAGRFARMKPTALFYNIGRGTTVNQDALIDALSHGRIAGAYLDVMDPEPLPPEHPLWRAPNCFITPHTGGGHHNEFEQIVRHFLANLARFERAEAMLNQVA